MLHEFSVIPGERGCYGACAQYKGYCGENSQRQAKSVYIDAQGPCVVTAGDIKTDADIEILNPVYILQHLARTQSSILSFQCRRGEAMSAGEEP